MNFENYIIKKLSREEIIAVYRDYAPAHFPDNERKPLSTVEALYDRNAYLGLGLFHQNTIAGYAFFLTSPALDTALLDYYAMLEDYRSLGLGSFFLQGMRDFFSDKAGIFIETEDPACAENEEEALLRNRRNAFYYKNGAHPTDLACTLFGVPFQIQFLPTQPKAPQAVPDTSFYRENMEALYRFMFSDEVYRQCVIWR